VSPGIARWLFWRVTLGLGGLVAFAGVLLAVVISWHEPGSCSNDAYSIGPCFTRGDVIVFLGVFGFATGFALGLLLWIFWVIALWLAGARATRAPR
jgi:hypothetical protein